ncbi:MAG TPA: COX15/CtaA family protein [Streptosporangiaceae bacterium]|nr:COX15/CtaA family protein [Streptosporangiaceae bacterium]
MSAQPATANPGWRATALVRHWAGVLLRPTPLAMRRIAFVGVLASLAIIPTGAAVRLSQSGLGCTDWPDCTANSLVASGEHGDPLIHQWVEFGNRLVTTAIFVIAIAVFIAAWRFRAGPDGKRRRDLVWLASAQPAGIAAQALIGGIVVLTKLSPFWVSLHYLATLPVLAAAVALHVRCTETTQPAKPLVAPLVRLVARALVLVASLMMLAGTLVTGTGPLAGAGDVPRYHFLSLTAITQLHADIGWVLGTLAVMLTLIMHVTEAPRRAVRLCWIVLGLIGLQGAIGYAQYFSGLPAGLVWVHVANTALIWIAIIRLTYALRDRGEVDAPEAADSAEPALSS